MSGETTRLLSATSMERPRSDHSRHGIDHLATESGYEELMGGNVPCPTCRGLGKIPKEHEGQLVALIPMRDKRLKPQRTILYVILAIIVCMLTTFLILFFLFPRDVILSSNKPVIDPIYLKVNVSQTFANITFINVFNFTNHNFVSVTITGARMTSLYESKQIAVSDNTTNLRIDPRSMVSYGVEMQIIFKTKEWEFLVKNCDDPRLWVHNLLINFEVTANYTFLGHEEQTTLSTIQPVNCYNETKL
ncbi:transmembrane protein 106B-like isoform X2 [Gigantopelta aegis]|nr:transmembrane protein 106B-like isoform X2 [Gigantopelta aegis]